MHRQTLAWILPFVLTLAGCGTTDVMQPGGGSGEVSLAIKNIQETKDLIASHKGKKVVVVDYWSTSCEPCMKEFPGLVKLAEKYPEDVAAISVSLDYVGGRKSRPEDKLEKVKGFLQSQKAAKVTNILAGDESDAVLEAIVVDPTQGVSSPPLVYVYARDGSLAKMFDNSNAASDADHFTYADVEKLVAELVAKK